MTVIVTDTLLKMNEFLVRKLPKTVKATKTDITLKMKRTFIHKYRKEWEQNPEFKSWLKPSSKGETNFHCKICGEDRKAGISAIKKHNSSDKHIKNSKSVKSSMSLIQSFSKSHNMPIDKQVKEGEIRISSFISEHNIAIESSSNAARNFSWGGLGLTLLF